MEDFDCFLQKMRPCQVFDRAVFSVYGNRGEGEVR